MTNPAVPPSVHCTDLLVFYVSSHGVPYRREGNSILNKYKPTPKDSSCKLNVIATEGLKELNYRKRLSGVCSRHGRMGTEYSNLVKNLRKIKKNCEERVDWKKY
jgi:hypothetical protein